MLSKDYILGFVEGEGCFSIGIGRYIDRRSKVRLKPSNVKNPYLFQIKPMFVITNVEANKDLLEKIRETIGVGVVYVANREQNASQQNVAQYRVQTFAGCRKVVEYFADASFQTEKGKDYLNWSKCLDLIEKGAHLRKDGLLEICALRDQMNFRKSKNKWTTEEVRKILEEKPIHQTGFFDANQQQLIHNNNMVKIDLDRWLASRQGNNKPSRFTNP